MTQLKKKHNKKKHARSSSLIAGNFS